MKLRKLFAGVAAAATLLGGMAFGATTANAAGAAGKKESRIGLTFTMVIHFVQLRIAKVKTKTRCA